MKGRYSKVEENDEAVGKKETKPVKNTYRNYWQSRKKRKEGQKKEERWKKS